jgi:predicted RNA binding protein YcfA (HicA-like mRNA interferase family)
MKSMAKQQLVKLLKANGVHLVRQDGDHEVWRVGECQTYVPKHKTISAGVCRSIRDALAPALGRDWLK